MGLDPGSETGHRERHLVDSNQRLSPYLIVSNSKCHLSVPFHCRPTKLKKSEVVVAVDLGINTTATVAVVASNGTVIHREFIHPGKDIDRRDQRLQRIRHKARLTIGSTGKLFKGFCQSTYRKCRNINQNIAHHVSKHITTVAKQFGAKVIVFEYLRGWRAKGVRKGSTLKQRFHGWHGDADFNGAVNLKALGQTLTLPDGPWLSCSGSEVTGGLLNPVPYA